MKYKLVRLKCERIGRERWRMLIEEGERKPEMMVKINEELKKRKSKEEIRNEKKKKEKIKKKPKERRKDRRSQKEKKMVTN